MQKEKTKKFDPLIPNYLRDFSDKIAKYPTCWNVNDCSKYLKVDDNLLSVRYDGTYMAAAIRTNRYIPENAGIYYFEVDILEGGDGECVSIGIATLHLRLESGVGWDPCSIGYHGDDGLKYCEAGFGVEYGPTFTTGDTIGCCIDFFSNEVFFTKNGVNLGYACSSGLGKYLYPAVGLKSRMAWVEANFGNRPFKFDIQLYAKANNKKNYT